MEQLGLEGTVAVVTGGGTGIGKEIARLFCRAGCRVVIASRKEKHLRGAEEEFAGLGLELYAHPLDVTRPDDVEAFARHVASKYGRLDILVNNAGGNFICPARKLSVNGWLSVININLNGSFYCSKFLGEEMIRAGRGGSIINLVATYAWTGAPGNVHSSASKAGVIALTRTLAGEWAQYGIRVNAVAPGPIETPIATKQLKFAAPSVLENLLRDVPLRRLGKPEEAAKAVLFLASPAWSSYITGEVLVADGGHVLYGGIDPEAYLDRENNARS